MKENQWPLIGNIIVKFSSLLSLCDDDDDDVDHLLQAIDAVLELEPIYHVVQGHLHSS